MKQLFLLLLITSCSTNYNKVSVLEGRDRATYDQKAKHIMISSQGEHSSLAGKTVYEMGGNIYDVAAAVTFAISVERPQSTGIGGGGFALIKNANEEATAIDFREMAPRMARKNMYLDKKGEQIIELSRTGALAVATPGLVKGILELHEKYGKLKREEVMAPAINLAENGFPVYPALAMALKYKANDLKKYPDSAKIFLDKNGEPLKEGDKLVQTDLARTLRIIAEKGIDGFYKGEVANKIVASMKKHKGLVSHADLQNYVVKERVPVVGTYKGTKIVSMPPPSSGGVHIIQIMNMLENDDLKSLGAQSAEAIHLTASAMQIAFSDRAQYMGDDDFVKVPTKDLTSKEYAKKQRAMIPKDKAIDENFLPKTFKEVYESPETTHFTIMDNEGNVFASTQTINGWFGSSLVAEGTGIVLNNEMDDFASHVGGINLFGAVGGKANLVGPRKRPLSSMSPTILVNEKNEAFMALGTPSGTRILTCVMQTILNTLEYDLPLWDAVALTRYHHQWKPNEIRIEAPYFSKETEEKLKKMGHNLKHQDLGCKIQAIRTTKDGLLHGVSDPREEGMSVGL